MSLEFESSNEKKQAHSIRVSRSLVGLEFTDTVKQSQALNNAALSEFEANLQKAMMNHDW